MIGINDAMESYVLNVFTCRHTDQYWSEVQDLYRAGTMDYDVLASSIKLYRYFYAMSHDGWEIELHSPFGCSGAKKLWPDTPELCHCTLDREPKGVIMSPEAMETYLLILLIPGMPDDDDVVVHTLLRHYRRAVYCVYAGGAIVLTREREKPKVFTANVFPNLLVKTSLVTQ